MFIWVAPLDVGMSYQLQFGVVRVSVVCIYVFKVEYIDVLLCEVAPLVCCV